MRDGLDVPRPGVEHAGVQHVLIVGASRGLGLALVRFALSQSCRVTAIARGAASPLRAAGGPGDGKLAVALADVRSDDELRRAAAELSGSRFDAIVYNAAIHPERGETDIEQSSSDEVLATLDVNAVGAARVARHFRPLLAPGGLLAFISSEAGSITDCGRTTEYGYCMSKAALNMLARLLENRERQRGTGVRVVSVHPGWIRTDMGGPNAHLSPEEAARDLWKLLETRAVESGPPFVDRLGEALPW